MPLALSLPRSRAWSSRAALWLLAPAALACAATTGQTVAAGASAPASVLGSSATAAPAVAAPGPVVILVRHGEKRLDQGADPALSEAGAQRAAALASLLRGGRVTRIVVTQLQRTRATAAPLAAARGLTPVVVPVSGDVAGHAAAVAAEARRAGTGDTVVVVGHSNTVGAIAAALGAPRPADLCDAQYAVLLTVTPRAGA